MTVVPFTITGTADQPAFTLDLTGKRSLLFRPYLEVVTTGGAEFFNCSISP